MCGGSQLPPDKPRVGRLRHPKPVGFASDSTGSRVTPDSRSQESLSGVGSHSRVHFVQSEVKTGSQKY
eukprot:365943-Chlamydomonas_euryale.AAC.8